MLTHKRPYFLCARAAPTDVSKQPPTAASDTGPLLVLDRIPQLDGQASRTDRTRIPAVSRRSTSLLQRLCARSGEFLSAFFEHSLAVGGDQALDGFDPRR